MKLYALALSAKNNIRVSYIAAACLASNSDEATGIGIRLCKDTFPESDGYGSHGAVYLEIPPKLVDAVRKQEN